MIIRHLALFLLAVTLVLVGPSKSAMTAFEYDPPDGFVPDAETAEKMCGILLTRMFSETDTERQMPLRATLRDNVWIVRGTMHPVRLGGTAEMHISKRDARVLYFKQEE